ncbi:MAG: aminotransferase class V-fold PLP-dependent enzyme [Rhodothermales bacterium]
MNTPARRPLTPAPSEPAGPAYDLEHWRTQIPLLERRIPLNNCSHAPQTHRTRAAAETYLASWHREGMDWETWMNEVHLARVEFARLINASPDAVAVSTSVSAATAGLASAFDFTGPRTRIVATEAEFPTVAHVWLAHQKYGAHVDWVPVHDGMIALEDYDAAIDDQTLIVSACHGYYQNGFKQNLAAIAERAHARGAFLYVDAYQTLGTHPVDVEALDVDFLSSGTLKYLMGVPGIAFLYVRPAHLERLHPAVTGWFGRIHPFAFDAKTLDWSPSARRFDTGTPPVLNAYIARAGMSIINEIGPAPIRDWTDQLSRRLLTGGTDRGLTIHGPTDYRRKTPSTAFLCPFDAHLVEARLRRRGILASARGPVIRLAPHFYTTLDEIDTALDALVEVFAEGEADEHT